VKPPPVAAVPTAVPIVKICAGCTVAPANRDKTLPPTVAAVVLICAGSSVATADLDKMSLLLWWMLPCPEDDLEGEAPDRLAVRKPEPEDELEDMSRKLPLLLLLLLDPISAGCAVVLICAGSSVATADLDRMSLLLCWKLPYPEDDLEGEAPGCHAVKTPDPEDELEDISRKRPLLLLLLVTTPEGELEDEELPCPAGRTPGPEDGLEEECGLSLLLLLSPAPTLPGIRASPLESTRSSDGISRSVLHSIISRR